MANYTIIGGDGKEYGPITETDVRLWLTEGRLNGQSLAKAESDAEFRPLEKFPEFASSFGSHTPETIAPLQPSREFSADGDYELDLTGCISQGWNLVKDNVGVLFVSVLIYLMIEFMVGLLGNIPLIGPLFSLANFICSGALMGGIFYLFLLVIRGEPAALGEMFSGFRRGFVQLLLAVLVQGLLIGLCLLPFIIVLGIKFFPMISHLQGMQHGSQPDAETMGLIKSAVFTSLPVLLLCMLPATYLAVCWKFTLPLIVDKQIDFITAMKTSWRQVNKHWWQIFGLLVLIGLLNVAGFLACCVGLLWTMPVGFAALMLAYETIFNAKKY